MYASNIYVSKLDLINNAILGSSDACRFDIFVL